MAGYAKGGTVTTMNTATLHMGDNLVETGDHPVVSVINKRGEQQDAALTSAHMCAIADGMGGHADGAAAARATLTALSEAIDGPATLPTIVEAVAAANMAVRELDDDGYRPPGATLVAVIADPAGTQLHGIWVGDSRAYLIDTDGNVDCLTRDHAYRATGGLYRCIGAGLDSDSATPDTFTVETGHGHKILLCSDGVSGPTDRNTDDNSAYAAAADDLEQFVRNAADQGSDNATAICVDVDALAGHATSRRTVAEPAS